jgi:hypothetical protein
MGQGAVQSSKELPLEGFVKQGIEGLIAEFCQTLPAPVSATCTSCIEVYIDPITADIEAFDLCRRLGLCDLEELVCQTR